MCALETPSSNDDTLTRARESLQALLSAPAPDTDAAARAADALQALRARLQAAQRRRAALADASRCAASAAAAAADHTRRIDSELIAAKLQAGELLTERDSIARDLARARRALARLDDAVGDAGLAQPEAGSTDAAAQGEESLEALVARVADEMERMSVAEKMLVEVVDEINAVKKRRAELEEKVRAAQEEW